MEAPIRLFLVRHGNTFEAGVTSTQVGARTDIKLTAAGREQADAVARMLTTEEITPKAIFCSPLKRQYETAIILQSTLGEDIPLEENEESLREIDYGDWENLTVAQLKEGWPEDYANWVEAAEWPNGIFAGSKQERITTITAFLKKLRENYSPGDAVVAVSSAGVIRYFRSLIEKEWQVLQQERRMKEIKVSTGSVSELLVFPDRVEVLRWNEAT